MIKLKDDVYIAKDNANLSNWWMYSEEPTYSSTRGVWDAKNNSKSVMIDPYFIDGLPKVKDGKDSLHVVSNGKLVPIYRTLPINTPVYFKGCRGKTIAYTTGKPICDGHISVFFPIGSTSVCHSSTSTIRYEELSESELAEHDRVLNITRR